MAEESATQDGIPGAGGMRRVWLGLTLPGEREGTDRRRGRAEARIDRATGGAHHYGVRHRRRHSRKAGFAGVVLAAASLSLGVAHASPGAAPAGGVSGYAVSNVGWRLDAEGAVAAVVFRLAPARAHTVRVRLAAGGRWLDCALRDGRASCPVPGGAAASGLGELSVIAF